MKPTISICVPTYNGAKYLSECLDSILEQTIADFELLVVDDKSTDRTMEILKEYNTRDKRIKIIKNEYNLGLVNNWNRCIELANGEWIKFVFQDDFIVPNCLERMLSFANSKNIIICCKRNIKMEHGVDSATREWINYYLKYLSIESLFPGKKEISSDDISHVAIDKLGINFFGEPTAILIRKSSFYKFGMFNPYFIQICDLEYWLRVCIHTGLVYVPETLATFRVHKSSASLTNRDESHHRTTVLDPLLLLHEFAFNPTYEPLRIFCAKHTPPIDLINLCAYETRQARKLIIENKNDLEKADTGRLAAWNQLAHYYPNLDLLSKKILIHSKLLKRLKLA